MPSKPALQVADSVVRPLAEQAWVWLVVDHEPEVHALADSLAGVKLHGRALQVLHAGSAQEALSLLNSRSEIALILLAASAPAPADALVLLKQLRVRLGRNEPRVILSTGAHDEVPALETIRDFDISAHLGRQELTRGRLLAVLTTASRAYGRIRRLGAQRRALEAIVSATPGLLAATSAQDFSFTLLRTLARVLELPECGFVCRQADGGSRVEASLGGAVPGAWLAELEDDSARDLVLRALAERSTQIGDSAVALYVPAAPEIGLVVWVPGRSATPPALHVLDLLASHAALCAQRLTLTAQLSEFAYRDSLTGLPNRRGLIEAIERRVAREGRSQLSLALADIDQFAEINDAFGHPYGDRLLQLIGHRLALADQDWVTARLGSDSFAVLGPTDSVTPGRLRELLTLDLEVDGQIQPLSVTLGLLKLRDGAGSAPDLLQDANLALKQAKLGTRGREVWYSPAMGVEIRERLRLLSDLRRAFDEERLFVVYQPQVELGSGRVVGAEALLRWRNDEGKFVAPERFIPLAETSGLIIALGGWVLRQACHAQRKLHEAGHPGIRVAVNVSVAQFRDPHMLARVEEAMADSGIDPAMLELELTESVAMAGATRIGQVFQALREIGVQIAIDDFGTGFSSLAYLQKLPIDRLKIDRSFVHELGAHQTRSIAEMVARLGATLGVRVVGEGVEDEAQARALLALGCHEAQGFYFARPMPLPDLLKWMAGRAAPG